MTRRPRIRRTEARCPKCGSRVAWDISPLAYVKHVHGRDLTETAWEGQCPCGERLRITVGEVFRAA